MCTALRLGGCAALLWLGVGCWHHAPTGRSATPHPRLTEGDDEARSTVEGEQLRALHAVRFEDLLRGIPGVEVNGSGANISVRIRGIATLNGSSDPLYVLDGVPLQLGSREALTSIDPKTVERIDVLKDAGATALYGARGANGVILITTHRP
ncbi:MAG TPA: TonB-dependent receptor plug domain-containing protein [Gemmatimonadaceae bacterium]|nr:TonB-dependent receptor plug domain-containing protein [Gemmatimonadaceae bacterium]